MVMKKRDSATRQDKELRNMRKIFYVWFNNQDTADMTAEVVKDIVYAHGGVVGLTKVDNIEPDTWVLEQNNPTDG